jgi:hypothetical protein
MPANAMPPRVIHSPAWIGGGRPATMRPKDAVKGARGLAR